VRVRDNGRGFPPEAARDVFAMFRRLDPSGESGSGVGLAICRRIVERHGGTITAEGRPGEGAIFHVVLPRALAAPARAAV
jgi:signal transduction histidine kinase